MFFEFLIQISLENRQDVVAFCFTFWDAQLDALLLKAFEACGQGVCHLLVCTRSEG